MTTGRINQVSRLILDSDTLREKQAATFESERILNSTTAQLGAPVKFRLSNICSLKNEHISRDCRTENEAHHCNNFFRRVDRALSHAPTLRCCGALTLPPTRARSNVAQSTLVGTTPPKRTELFHLQPTGQREMSSRRKRLLHTGRSTTSLVVPLRLACTSVCGAGYTAHSPSFFALLSSPTKIRAGQT